MLKTGWSNRMTNEQLVVLINNGKNATENMLQLWEQNKGFIYKIAIKYQPYAEMEDLTQEGYFGLCEAVRHYNCEQGISFIYYAAFWIKQVMRRYIANCGNSIRLPEYAINEVQQYKKIKRDYIKKYGIEPTEREIKGLLGVSEKKYESIKKNALIPHIHSLSEPISGEGEILLEDALASDQELEEDIVKMVDTETMKVELWQTVDDLPGNMGVVLRYRYKDGLTLKESGEKIGVTLERIRVIENKAMRHLRSSTRNRNLKLYYEQYLEMPIRHVGVREFNRTWTSSVEQTVLGWLNE